MTFFPVWNQIAFFSLYNLEIAGHVWATLVTTINHQYKENVHAKEALDSQGKENYKKFLLCHLRSHYNENVHYLRVYCIKKATNDGITALKIYFLLLLLIISLLLTKFNFQISHFVQSAFRLHLLSSCNLELPVNV